MGIASIIIYCFPEGESTAVRSFCFFLQSLDVLKPQAHKGHE